MTTAWHLFTRWEVAQSEMDDDARSWIESADPQIFAARPDDVAAIQAARGRGWKILPGMSFVHQAFKIDAEEQHYRSNEMLTDICVRYRLFGAG